MSTKPVYLHYVADNVYHIYKFSNYGIYKIQLIAAGPAYGKGGNYSEKFKRLIEKYDLDKYEGGIHTTSNTLDDFLSRVHMHSMVRCILPKIPIPKIAYDLIEERVSRLDYSKKLEEKNLYEKFKMLEELNRIEQYFK